MDEGYEELDDAPPRMALDENAIAAIQESITQLCQVLKRRGVAPAAVESEAAPLREHILEMRRRIESDAARISALRTRRDEALRAAQAMDVTGDEDDVRLVMTLARKLGVGYRFLTPNEIVEPDDPPDGKAHHAITE